MSQILHQKLSNHQSINKERIIIYEYQLLNIPISTKVAIRILYLFIIFTFLTSIPQKRLSIPATVTRAFKYVLELQQQVEGQLLKKEELLSKLSSQGDLSHQKMQSKMQHVDLLLLFLQVSLMIEKLSFR